MAQASRNHQNRQERGTYGSYGSLAYAPAPAQRPMPRERSVSRPLVAPAPKERLWPKLRLVLLVALICTGGLAVAWSNALIKQQQVKLASLQDELANLHSSNLSLEADVTGEINLDEVEKVAKARLGMSEPKSYQIVYIDVPKESSTTQYGEAQTQEAPHTFLANIWNKLKKD